MYLCICRFLYVDFSKIALQKFGRIGQTDDNSEEGAAKAL